MKALYLKTVLILCLLGQAACGETNAVSVVVGLPSVDTELSRMRWHFSTAAPVTTFGALNAGRDWSCVQRSAIARTNHTSYFKRTFADDNHGNFTGLAVFDMHPGTATSSATFRKSASGAIRGEQSTQTDRYQLYFDNVQVFLRIGGDNKLVEEWTVSRSAEITGRGGTMMPELIRLDDQPLMEPAFSDPNQLAFLYVSCDLVKR